MRGTNIKWLAGLWLVAASLAAQAQVYRCATQGGSVAYQDTPCLPGQKQALVNVPSHAATDSTPQPAVTVVATPANDANALPPPVYVPTVSPLPVMYACVGAVNGKHYLTRHPPPPYLAPLGVMGYPPQTLSEVYGSPGGAGASAPELAPKPPIGGPSIGAAMMQVEDFCMPAPKTEVCAFVQRQYDDNHRKLRMAMRSEQPPFAQRERELRDQLRSCR